MATEDQIIVAIELGSSNVTGIAGKKMPDGTISVQAVVQEPSSMFIRRGMIFNLTKSAQCINSIKKQIEERWKRKITQVYVGYSGQGIHSIFNNVGRPLGGESRISKEIVDELEAENLKSDVGNHSILDIVPQSYVVGKETSSDPIGVIADSIEVKYMNIIARHALKSNIENCFKEASLHVAGCILTPVSEAKMLMTDSEKRSGCVLVDFGADTTSVVVYKENKLRYIAVIPLGSANVTKDIESCQLDEQEAESLKLKYGSATNEIATIEEGKELIYNFPDGSGITKQKFSEIVEARMKEILINVAQQIKESGFDKGTLIGGAIFTGGASAMKNLIPAFKKATGISQVRVVRNIPNVLFTKTSGPKETDGRFIAAICILDEGTQNCCGSEYTEDENNGIFDSQQTVPEHQQDELKPTDETVKQPKGPGFFKTLSKKLKDIGTTIVGDE